MKFSMTDPDQGTRTGRSARRASDTRKKLLDAAAEMFTTIGFDGCTIEDITERADVGKGTFYRHFEDKYAIITTLVESVFTEARQQLRTPREAPRQVQDAVLLVLDVHTNLAAARPDAATLLFQGRQLLRFHRGQAEPLEHAFQTYLADIEQVLAPLLPAPLPSPRLRGVACALTGFVLGFASTASVGMKKEEIAPFLASMRKPLLAAAMEMLK